MSVLPRFMLLKSNANGKFLCYGKNNLKGVGPTLSFSHEIKSETAVTADQPVLEPKRTGSEPGPNFHLIKFEVEEAKTAPGLVHIRTCYNNKYLIRKCLESKSNGSIHAEAHEAEEDQSKPTCTLFKPVLVEEGEEEEEEYLFANKHGVGKPPQRIQLVHVSQFGQHLVGSENDNGSIRSSDSSLKELASSTFTAYDVTTSVIIPEYFTLIGHDDKYISGFSEYNLGFVTTDIGGTNVAMWNNYQTEWWIWALVIRTNNSTGLSWTLNDGNGVRLVSSIFTGTVFLPVKAGNDHVALLCMRNVPHLPNNNFVHRVDAGTYDGVSARTMTSITNQCRLRIGEPVLSRTVSEPYYDLANARIYNTGNFQMYSDSRSNHTSMEQTGTFQVEYVRSHTSTWNQSQTVNVGVTFNMSFRIPFVGSAGVELSAGFESTTEWGGSSTEEETIRYTQNVTIPSGKRVTLRVLSTRSTCDVPLVCKVRDVMTNGTVREYTKTDIVFTGINSYNFDTVLLEQDVP